MAVVLQYSVYFCMYEAWGGSLPTMMAGCWEERPVDMRAGSSASCLTFLQTCISHGPENVEVIQLGVDFRMRKAEDAVWPVVNITQMGSLGVGGNGGRTLSSSGCRCYSDFFCGCGVFNNDGCRGQFTPFVV